MPEFLDVQAMKRIALRSHELAIETSHGRDGMDAMRLIIEFLIELYSLREPHGFAGTLFVVKGVTAKGNEIVGNHVTAGSVREENRIDRIALTGNATLVIEIRNGLFRIWNEASFDAVNVSKSAIVYQYHAAREKFVVAGDSYELDKPVPSYPSNFCRPRFATLREVLIDYRNRLVRTSGCFIFAEVWEDSSRICFHPGPEESMRRSLHAHLKATLPDATTRAEQPSDESHPVDLRVEWDLTALEAIIEIKWLGVSRENGHITVRYTSSRARQGAKQLVDYLNSAKQSAPTRQTRGYLVIIDGRRKGVREETRDLPRNDAMHYEHEEIEFDPRYHESRDDFEEPIRMFAEPA